MDFDGKDQVVAQVRENQTLYETVLMLQQQMLQMGVIIDAQNGTNVADRMAGQMQQEERQKTTGKGTTSINKSGGSLSRQAASTARNATAPQ